MNDIKLHTLIIHIDPDNVFNFTESDDTMISKARQLLHEGVKSPLVHN